MNNNSEKKTKDTILVTGGGGLIGSGLIYSLQNKFKIYCLDHNDKSFHFKKYFNNNVKFVKGDILDETLLDKIIRDCDIVIHLAGGGGNTACVNDPVWSVSTHILGTDLLLKKALKYKIKKFIFASSISVYTTYHKRKFPFKENIQLEPDDFYGSLKKAAEDLIVRSGINYCIFRFTNVYGSSEFFPIQKGGAINNFIESALKEKKIQIYGSGKQGIDYVNLKDLVRAISLVLEKNNKDCIYNIGSGKLVSIKKIAEVVNDVFKNKFNKTLKIEYIPIPNNKIWPDRLMSINKIKKDLEWKPEISLETGIKEMIVCNFNKIE
jgi:UDP-glucose 4-epimerase